MKNLDLKIFPQTSKENWKQLAEKQLKGANPDETLNWQNSAGISLSGYYDQSDVADFGYLAKFFNELPNHRWKLFQKIEVKDEKVANKQTLEALMGGCDGVIYNLQNAPDWNILLKEVNTDICDIGTDSDHEIDISKYNGPHLNPVNENATKLNPELDIVDQILSFISGKKEYTYILRSALSDFFLEIATLRAYRYLLSENNLGHVSIHTTVPLHHSAEHQWFLNTTAGLASILGGSHSIDLPTATGDPRISRNTANLIREESGIEEYSDQCGGSYYIEVLTDKIIQEAKKRLG